MRIRLPFFLVLLLALLAACDNLSPAPNADLAVTAVQGGEVVGWGDGGSGQTTAPALPEGVTYTAVSAGYFHSLGLRSDGQVEAWGSNALGQLNVPALPSGVTYTAVAAGGQHSLALRSDGQLAGWGLNDDGQTNIPAPPSGVTYTAIAAGDIHSLAVRSDGQAVGWGGNFAGQRNVPAQPAGVTYKVVAAGQGHSLGLLSNGQVVGWGDSGDGRTTAPALPDGVTYTAISAGQFHSLGLRSDGQSVGWGGNSNGQTTVPALPEGVTYTAVASGPGSRFSAWLRSDGQVVARGENDDGQANVPAPPEGKRYVGVAAGLGHGLGIAAPKEAQTVAFTSTPPDPATVGGSYEVSAQASSGLPVTIVSSSATVCTLSGSTVTFVAPGECVLTASQSGNGIYLAAEPVEQRFTVSVLPPPPPVAQPYTVDFETAPANKLTYSVKVGSGVTYRGQGSPSSATVPVVGKRAQNGSIAQAQVARVVSIYGSKRLIAGSSAASNTPNATGGRIKLTFTNFDSAGARLTSITLSNLIKRGAYLTFYYVDGSSSRQNVGTTAAGGSLVVPLSVKNLRALDVYAPNAYAVDDVKFEVPAKQ